MFLFSSKNGLALKLLDIYQIIEKLTGKHWLPWNKVKQFNK